MTTGVLRNRAFRLLWAGDTVSGLGSWLLVVALPVHVFQLTGSPTATGLTLALEALPALLLGPWAGVLLDRWRRHLARAMWLADLVSAAAVALILFADRPERLWLIYLAVLAENLATAVFRPAARALTPAVLGTGADLAAANALTGLSHSALRLAAPPLGALLLAGPGITWVLLIDAASYLVSAALVARAGRGVEGRKGRFKDRGGLREGLALVARTPPLWGALVGNGLFLTANAALTALLVPFVTGPLDAPGHGLGYLVSGLGAGFLVGSAASRRLLGGRLHDRLGIRGLLATAQLANAAAYFALFNAPNLPAAVAAAALLGVPGSVLLIATETHVQRTAPPAMLGRVAALFFAADSLATVLGALAAPALATAFGLTAALNALSAAALLAAPLTWRALRPTPAARRCARLRAVSRPSRRTRRDHGTAL